VAQKGEYLSQLQKAYQGIREFKWRTKKQPFKESLKKSLSENAL